MARASAPADQLRRLRRTSGAGRQQASTSPGAARSAVRNPRAWACSAILMGTDHCTWREDKPILAGSVHWRRAFRRGLRTASELVALHACGAAPGP
ncbi:hypothetical protein ACU4GD_15595 [Cupriavidus basilensis]